MPAEPLALLAIENVTTGGTVQTRQLVRLRFADGQPAERDVLTIRDQQFFGHFRRHQIHDGRWVITGQGNVIDAHRGEVMLEYGGEVLSIDEHRVFLRRRRAQPIEYHYHDLTTMRTYDMTEPGVWALPGVLSPDRTMSVSSSPDLHHDIGQGELWLHLVDEPPQRLAEGLHVRLSEYSSYLGARPPRLWLDNSRILTQSDNGQLRMVVIDGTSWPLVDIEELTGPDVVRVISPPRIYRDQGGQVVYSCARRSWVIDVAKGTAHPYEWVPLGHGFSAESWTGNDKEQAIRLHGREIGRLRHVGWDTASEADYLAVRNHDEQMSVWCGGEWHVIPGWFDSLVGWIAPVERVSLKRPRRARKA